MSKNSFGFSREEYDQRLARVRQKMAARGVDLLLVHTPENLFYLAGYDTSGYFAYQCLLVPMEGPCEIIVRRGEAENARRSTASKQHVYFDLDDVVKKTVDVVRSFPGVRLIGIEKNSWFLTTDVYERLRAELVPLDFTDCSNLIDVLRTVKSAGEIELIREAAGIADTAISAGMGAVRAGARETDIASAVSAATISQGSDYTGMPHLIKSGDRCPIGHAQWSRRLLERGDVVFMELSGCVNRYSAVAMRTCQIDPVDETVRRTAEAVISALNKTIDAMKPGALTGELYGVAIAEIVRAGFNPVPRRMGYSLGVGYPPRWGEWHVLDFQPNSLTPLEPGMVFHVIPGVMLNERATIGFSETVLITETGHEVLTSSPRKFITIT